MRLHTDSSSLLASTLVLAGEQCPKWFWPAEGTTTTTTTTTRGGGGDALGRWGRILLETIGSPCCAGNPCGVTGRRPPCPSPGRRPPTPAPRTAGRRRRVAPAARRVC